MRNINRDTITRAVLDSFSAAENPRTRFLLERLVTHLHDYAREVELTPDEWKTAIDFLYNAGKISDAGRNEFILASDVLGLSSLIDMLQTGEGSTERSALGPFHASGSLLLEVGGDIARENAGVRMLARGRVYDCRGTPLPGATLDFWQAADNGLYWQQDPTQDRNNLRFTMIADGEGRYAFTTIRPAPYKVPYDASSGTAHQRDVTTMLAHPLKQLFSRTSASCDAHNDLLRIINRSIQFASVQQQECLERCMADALVSINERAPMRGGGRARDSSREPSR